MRRFPAAGNEYIYFLSERFPISLLSRLLRRDVEPLKNQAPAGRLERIFKKKILPLTIFDDLFDSLFNNL